MEAGILSQIKRAYGDKIGLPYKLQKYEIYEKVICVYFLNPRVDQKKGSESPPSILSHHLDYIMLDLRLVL